MKQLAFNNQYKKVSGNIALNAIGYNNICSSYYSSLFDVYSSEKRVEYSELSKKYNYMYDNFYRSQTNLNFIKISNLCYTPGKDMEKYHKLHLKRIIKIFIVN